MEASWVIIALALYMAVGALLSQLAKKRLTRGFVDYFIASRSLSGLVAALSYSATTYSAFMMVGLVGYAYAFGVGSAGFELVYLVGAVMLMATLGLEMWRRGRERGYATPAELLSDVYGSRAVGALYTAICLVVLVPYVSVQMMGMGYLFEGMTNGALPYEAGAALTVVVAILWTLWAGLRSVAWTDSLQAAVMLGSSIALLAYVLNYWFGGLGGLAARLKEVPELLTMPGPGWPFEKFLGLTVPWFFFALTNPQVSQRHFTPRGLGGFKAMVLGHAAFGLAYTVIVTLLGLAARLVVPGLPSPDEATPALLALVPGPLALLVFIGVFSAAVTTVDSIMLTLSSMAARDLYRAGVRGVSEEVEVSVGKVAVVAVALLGLGFSFLRPGLIVELSVISAACLVSCVPAFVDSLTARRGCAEAAVASMLVGTAVAVVLQLARAKPLGGWPGVWSLATSTLVFVAASLLKSRWRGL